jgi:UDP-glucose 4-epimerase
MAKSVETTYARFFHRSFDLATVVLRFGIVYGPGEESRQRLIPHVTSTLLRGESPRLSSGTQTADWLFIDDATAALMAAAVATTAPGRVLNVGAGRSTSVRELVDRLARLIDNGVAPQFGVLPDRPAAPTRDAEPAEVLDVLGWSPATELSDGLREVVAYYRANP